MCNGFSLVGKLPELGVFQKKFRPAELSESDLRQSAKRSREAIIGTLGPSPDRVIDEGVLAATQKEVQAGHVRGPISMGGVPPDETVARRFGVRQGETDAGPKVRPIDDYRESLLNAAVAQTEQVPVHSLDVVAATVSYWLQAEHVKCGGSDLHVKCWDLHAAYKQLPLDDPSFARDAFFGIYNPRSKQKELYRQLVLPFGSKASVTAFIRAAFALWRIAVLLLKVVWTFYFDDFLNVCRAEESRHMEIVISMYFHLLGMKFWGTLRAILAAGSLERGELAKVRGRLQFASGQLFGRLARQAVHAFSSKGRLGSGLDHRLTWALEYLSERLAEGKPREISRGLGDTRLVFVDTCFDEYRETVIYELEALAVTLAIDVFRKELLGRNVT
ncbi:unnamed protein product, partial [Symbiodinium pilosum]